MNTPTKDHTQKPQRQDEMTSGVSVESMLNEAIAAFNRGAVQKALDGVEQVLRQHAKQPDALHIKGVLLGQVGQLQAGIESLEQAIAVQPAIAQFHTNLGNLYQRVEDFKRAKSSHLKAIEIDPHYADAYNNLGVVCRNLGDSSQAIEYFKKAVAIQPTLAAAHNNLGNALHSLSELDAARESYLTALQHNEQYLDAAISLGAVYQASGNLAEAQQAYARALDISPDSVEAHNDLGLVYSKLGELELAVASFENALRLNSDYAQAHVNLGMVLQQQGKISQAIPHFETAIELDPTIAEAYNNYGNALKDQRRVIDAVQMYERALQVLPTYASAFSNYLFTLNYIANVSRKEIYEKHREWALKFAAEEEPLEFPTARKMRKGDKIRIGYVSADLRLHSVGYFMECLISLYDQNRYEVYCYYDYPVQDSMSQRLSECATEWRAIYGLTDAAVVDIVKRDHIDILIDLSGHTGFNRLNVFSQRPAPVQMSYLGYPNTTGLKSIQYRITDQYADPMGTDAYYSEQLIRMEHSFLCYSPPENAPAVAPRPAEKNHYVNFGSFNNVTKITDTVIRIWSKILCEVENSRLILKSNPLVDEGLVEQMLTAFESHGVDRSRLELQGFVAGAANHLALYATVDIALDPFPYNGTTTTLEALWMGVPVIALVGDRHCARVGVSILHNLDEPDLLADNYAEYVNKAVNLAKDHEQLVAYRRDLRTRLAKSPLMTAQEFSQSFEMIIERIWLKHSNELNKADLDLDKDTLIIHTKEKVDIAVPNNIAHMSTYVLREQEDWFEDELNFVRSYLQPGMQVIDVGANIGVYALMMAGRVGESGKVWAFEPNFLSYRFLQRGIEANQFKHVHAIQAGVSNQNRQAFLFSQSGETTVGKICDETIGDPIELHRLDEKYNEWGKPKIDFIKIDVEGHESEVFEGAIELLQTSDPLVMYEFRSLATHNVELVEKLRLHGYTSYRLIASLNLLMPIDVSGKMDSYWLNLFACSEVKATQLAEQGLLIRDVDSLVVPPIESGRWQQDLEKFPLGKVLQQYWQAENRSKDVTDWEQYCAALDYYFTSQDATCSTSVRYAALLQALVKLTDLVADHATVPRMCSLAKVASQLGLRDTALMIVDLLIEEFENSATIDISEPFLCLSEYFETIMPGDDLSAWIYACLLDFKERNYAFSSYFFPHRSKARLQRLEQLGFLSCEMQRRKILIEMREGVMLDTQTAKALQHVSPDNLNPLHWK